MEGRRAMKRNENGGEKMGLSRDAVANVKTGRSTRRHAPSKIKRDFRLFEKGDPRDVLALKKQGRVFRSNARLARTTWGAISRTALQALKELTDRHGLSIAGGDLQQLDGRWYVTHAGLLGLARLNHFFCIRVQP